MSFEGEAYGRDGEIFGQREGLERATVKLSFYCEGALDPSVSAANAMLANVLGKILNNRLREDKGYIYATGCIYEKEDDLLTIRFNASPDLVDRCLATIGDTLRDLPNNVDPKLFERIKEATALGMDYCNRLQYMGALNIAHVARRVDDASLRGFQSTQSLPTLQDLQDNMTRILDHPPTFVVSGRTRNGIPISG